MILQPPPEKSLPTKTHAQLIHNPPITAMHLVVQNDGNSAFDGASGAGLHEKGSQDPPPYSAGPSRSVRPAQQPVVQQPVPQLTIQRAPLQLPARNLSPKPTNPACNHVFIRTKHEPVRGTFNIDSELAAFALDKSGASAVDRRIIMQKNRQRHRHHQRKAFRRQQFKLDPSAIFGTRDAPIDIDLSLVSPPEGELKVHKTLVQASTKRGDIDIRVRYIDPRRRLNLEVASKRGTTVLLLPRSYSGYIKVHNANGRTEFLPAMRGSTHLVAQNERELQVVIGDARFATPTQGTEWDGDLIHVASKNGDVFIGYVDEDSKPESQPSIWQKLGVLLGGVKSTRRAIRGVQNARARIEDIRETIRSPVVR
ncbi:hypothetical protein M422DRAFT_24271 [Sphaerobolus stellatus SS14]|nr:hypothetical protein M422DRAFT_24271 [Sphaerobolus stellatus SS14]